MALLDSEGFGWTTSAADLTTYGAFTSIGSGAVINTGGPLGDNYYSVGANGQTRRLLPSAASGFFAGARLNLNGVGALAYFDAPDATNQIYVDFLTTGQITVYRNGTLIGTSGVGLFPASAWFYCEIGAVIASGTSGSVTVRVNGATAYTLTGVNTEGDASGTVQRYGWESNNSSASSYSAHWYYCDNTGSAPWNTFLGDVRVQTIVPTSNATVQFTPSPTSFNVILNPNIASSISDTANTVYFDRWTTTNGGNLNSISLTVQTGFTGHLKMAIYSDNGSGYPNALLGTSSVATNPVTGLNTVTFSGVTLTNFTIYWIAIVTDTTFTIETAGTGPSAYRNSYSLAYASAFAGTAPTGNATTTSFSTYTMNISPENFSVAATIPPAPATFYNSDLTVGNQDTFNTAGTAASTSTVYGLHHKGIYSKSTAGSRSMQSVLVSGGTTGTGASTPLGTSGVQVRTMFETDPNTSAQWTTAAANAAQPGYNVSA